MTLEEEFHKRHALAEIYFDRIDGLKDAIDDYIGKVRQLENNCKFRTRGELLGSLLRLEFEFESVTCAVKYCKKKACCQLLKSTNRTFSYNLTETFTKLKWCIKTGEHKYHDLKSPTYAGGDLNSLAKKLDNDQDKIFKIIRSQIQELLNATFGTDIAIMAQAEEINKTWNEQLSRYEADNASLYDSFFKTVYDPAEALRELSEERDNNVTIKLWHKMREPGKFISALREKHEAVELDLLPVFDYEIKRKRLQEMIKAETHKHSGNMDNYAEHCTFIDKQYINTPNNGYK